MNNEEKQLVKIDICGRLPYNVRGEVGACKNCIIYPHDIEDFEKDERTIIPYLRPMSSMTEDESAELSNIISEWFDKELFYLTEEPFLEYALSKINYSISPKLFDWLNAHHFDYRGLIPKGLALEAPEGMYKVEE